MSTDNVQRIEDRLNTLKDPHAYGWSLFPLTREAVAELEKLRPEERSDVWSRLIQPRLMSKDRKDLTIALQVCSMTPIPEAKGNLLELLGRREVTEDWRLLYDLLIALGHIQAGEALPTFQKYVYSVPDESGETSRVGVAAILALGELDIDQAVTHLPAACKGDFQYRNDLSHPGIGYRNSDILLVELLTRHKERAIQPVAQQILKLDSQLQAFVRAIVNVLLERSAKFIQDFGKTHGEEYVRDEKAKQQLLLQLRHALEPVNPSSTTP